MTSNSPEPGEPWTKEDAVGCGVMAVLLLAALWVMVANLVAWTF